MNLRPHQQRALNAISINEKGQIIVPTGGGKTLIMIKDVVRRLEQNQDQTIVIVAPRILLAEQLCSEFTEFVIGAQICHVHSGETHYYRTTKSEQIEAWVDANAGVSRLIFTTYHSLNRVVDAGIDISVAYFDEAHNSTQKSHFISVAATSMIADNCYFFTATPKHSRNPNANGMNNTEIYGRIIENVRAKELIQNGSILEPKVETYKVDLNRDKETAAESDRNMIVQIVDNLAEENSSKILVAAPSTKVLWNMLTKSDIMIQMQERGYDILHITSKHGAYVNNKKVNREVFFNTLTEYGKDPNRKFVLFHYSILSEGINVPGLTHCILLRQLPIIEMAQTIGRVIRMNADDAKDIASGKIPAGACHLYRKQYGYVTVPVFSNYGGAIARRLESVVKTIFVDGIPAISVV